MNIVMVGLIRFSGYFSFKRIPLKLSHSSANRSGEDESSGLGFNIVIRRDHLKRHQHGFDDGKVGLHLLFSCKHMFSAVSQSLRVPFR